MTTRAYDYILTLSSVTNFAKNNVVIGKNSNTVAQIIAIDNSNNNVRVKINNVYQEFSVGEALLSNVAVVYTANSSVYYSNTVSTIVRSNSYILNGVINTFALPNSVDFKDEISVKIDNNQIDSSYFKFPSSTLGGSGIDFLPTTILTANGNTIAKTFSVFPNINSANLKITVARGQLEVVPYFSPNISTYITSANANISAIYTNRYSSEKNAFQQNPIVSLVSIYYPGEWYPYNSNGNPTGSGTGYPWPYTFPYRYATIIGETLTDISYSILQNSTEYLVKPINISPISVDSSGKINEISMEIGTQDGSIISLIENSYLLGNNNANATTAIVNNELVTNIDPRTVAGNSLYNSSIVSSRGGANVPFDYNSTLSINGNWKLLKQDTRDLLGAVVEIKTTFANYLDVWPEYSLIRGVLGKNGIEVYSSTPYRINDKVRSNTSLVTANVINIDGNVLILDNENLPDAYTGNRLYIINPNADPFAYTQEIFKITRLDELNEQSAKFTLTNWLQYFKNQIPTRKTYKNSCSWDYKGAECQYPSSGVIPNTQPPRNSNGFFTINNATTTNSDADECSKTITGCSLRNNLSHFGGFPGVDDDF